MNNHTLVHFHFLINYNNVKKEGTYACENETQLKDWIQRYFPQGEGRDQKLLDMESLQIIGEVEPNEYE